MEQKRTLWIVLASGIFLLVVIGVALILYAPKKHKAASFMDTSTSLWVDPVESKDKTPDEIQPFTYEEPEPSKEPEADFTSYTPYDYDEPSVTEEPEQTDIQETSESGVTTTTIDLTEDSYSEITAKNAATLKVITENELARKLSGKEQKSGTGRKDSKNTEADTSLSEKTAEAESSGKSGTKEVKTSSEKVSKTGKSSGKASASDDYAYESESHTSKSSESKGTSSVSRIFPSAKDSSKEVSSSKNTKSSNNVPAEKEPDRFWVQAGSFASRKKADAARELLTQKGMQCEVFTFRDTKGTLYFRVRIGPYTTKTEADFWKKEISKLSEFNNAFVTNTTVHTK